VLGLRHELRRRRTEITAAISRAAAVRGGRTGCELNEQDEREERETLPAIS
jgi:hypothetical protein